MKPHGLFRIWEPDTVAECLDVPDELSRKLWSFVKDYKAPRPEVSEEPCIGTDCLARFWSRLTPIEQRDLNILAIQHEREWER